MPTQIVMDATGDTRHEFDPADAAAVAEAENRFRDLTGGLPQPYAMPRAGRSSCEASIRPPRRPYSFLDYRAAET